MTEQTLLDAAACALEAAKKAGATAADVLIGHSSGLSIDVRQGVVENAERAESTALSIRAFVGQRMALVAVSDIHQAASIGQRAVELARVIPEDALVGLADQDLLCQNIVLPDCYDPAPEPLPQTLEEWAQTAEQTALAVPNISNSEGASASYGRITSAYVTSHGFSGVYSRTSAGISCTMVAGTGTAMERDYAYTAACYSGDLLSPQAIGQEAAERTVKRLSPQKPESGRYNVVFNNRTSSEILGYLAGAISGSTWARGSSFLRDYFEKPVFSSNIQIFDDPCRARGLGSRAFDAEGIGATRLQVIENGVLSNLLLDTVTAKKLGKRSNGRASRGVRGNPHPSTSNFYMAAGDLSLDDLLRQVGNGLFITDTIGDGLNDVTGDYSIGASGFRIINGQLVESVSEFTIAGNMRDIFAALVPANDLVWRSATNAPSLWLGQLMVAGSGG